MNDAFGIRENKAKQSQSFDLAQDRFQTGHLCCFRGASIYHLLSKTDQFHCHWQG